MRIKAVVWVIAITVALLVIASGFQQYCDRQLAQQWQEQLEKASESELRPLMRGTMDLGPLGVGRVAEALGASRREVSWAARDVLIERLELWKTSSPIDTTHLQESLIEALANEVDRLAPPLQVVAVDCATQVLRLPTVASAARRQRLVACCEKILRSKGRPTAGEGSLAQGDLDSVKHPDLAINLNIGGVTPVMSGGGLPVDVFTPPLPPSGPHVVVPSSLPRDTMEQSLAADRQAEPALQQKTPIEPETLQVLSSLTPLGNPRAPVLEASLAAPLPKEEKIRRLSLAEARASFDRSSRRAVSNLAMAASTEEIRELIRQMEAGDEVTVSRARMELARQGFTETHFKLARRLSDPSPEVRHELARSVVSLTGVDAAPWLLWLAADGDAEVRLTAITLIASSGTPDLVSHAAELASRDSDPRIRRQAEQIERLRR